MNTQSYSLSYFNDIRKSRDGSLVTMEGSSVVRVNNTVRLGHLLQLMPLTIADKDENGTITFTPADYLVYQEAGAYMALRHFNDRNSAVVPGLAERLASCDFYFTMHLADTRQDVLFGSRIFYQAVYGTLTEPFPTGVVGAYSSAESKPLAVLSGATQIPQISPSSTSSDLDRKADAPLFARTVPTNTGDSNAVVLYFQSLGVTNFAVVFINDSFGDAYHSSLVAAASKFRMTVLSLPFRDDDEDSMRSAVQKIQASKYKYVYAIVTELSWKFLLAEGYRLGNAGNSEHVWMFGEGLEFIQLSIDLRKEPEIAAAMQGMGVVQIKVPVNKNLASTLEEFRMDPNIHADFIANQHDPTIFDFYNLSAAEVTKGPYEHTNYDAVIALGIAACEAQNEFFTGQELYDQVKKTSFEGASGSVSFDPQTGTRRSENVIYVVNNLVKNEKRSTAETIEFDVIPAIEVVNGKLTILEPFVYADYGLIAPPSLPAYNMNMNLIPRGLQVFGWVLAALVIFFSSWCMYWTIKKRKNPIIRAAQPIFLCQLCVGTFIMACTVIPLSLQEPVNGLDASCIAIPWVFSTGFVTAFSSLLAKQWRINRIFQISGKMRRTDIKAKDVFWIVGLPFFINYAVLLTWTIVAPLQWTRVLVDNFDSFGRRVESYGTCWATGSSPQFAFALTLFLINMLMVIFANYQSYLARHVPSDFNESVYVALSMASILEAMLLGLPITFLTLDSPSASFVVTSVVITIVCFAVLVPLFVPKYWKRSTRIDKDQLNQYWNNHKSRRNSQEGSHARSSVAAIRASILNRESQQQLQKVVTIDERASRCRSLQESSDS